MFYNDPVPKEVKVPQTVSNCRRPNLYRGKLGRVEIFFNDMIIGHTDLEHPTFP